MSDWPETLVLTVELGVLLYAAFVALTIVLERRRPATTLAWILALILLPGVGLRPGGERPDLEPDVERLYTELWNPMNSKVFLMVF